MEELLQGMDQFIEKTKKVVQRAEFQFHEKIFLIGIPVISKSSSEDK